MGGEIISVTFFSLTLQQKPPRLSESFGAPILPPSPHVHTHQQPAATTGPAQATAAVPPKEEKMEKGRKEEEEEERMEEEEANFPSQDVMKTDRQT